MAAVDTGEAGDRRGRIRVNNVSLSLDSDQKDQLIEVIEKLLADKTTVRGSWAHGRAGAVSPVLPAHCPLGLLPSWWRAAW